MDPQTVWVQKYSRSTLHQLECVERSLITMFDEVGAMALEDFPASQNATVMEGNYT